MTITEFKRQLHDDVKEALEIMEGPDYLDTLPPNPSLEDYYTLFFTVWNDNIGDLMFEA
jgi:hypothetical protein